MPTPYSPGGRQRKAQCRRLACEEFVRDLNQQSGAVAGFRVAAAGAAMCQVDENLNAFFNNVVRLVAFDISHETDTTGIMLVARMVKTLRGRQAVWPLRDLGFSLVGVRTHLSHTSCSRSACRLSRTFQQRQPGRHFWRPASSD